MRPHPLFPRVVAAMQRIAPLDLADRSWDNVGVLLESPFVPPPASAAAAAAAANTGAGKVLLTIDLTPVVAVEALNENVSVIVAYHPFIFSGLKSITLRDPKQVALMQLVQQGCSVYCPHSALDAVEGGLNDWLCDIIDSSVPTSLSSASPAAASSELPLSPTAEPKRRRWPIAPNEANPLIGEGRFGRVASKVSLAAAIAAIKKGTGIGNVRVAVPDEMRDCNAEEIMIGSYAVCAGSGATMFRKLRGEQSRPDLLLAGEMDHHSVLGFIQKGCCVVLCEHTNSERGYLTAVLQARLLSELNNGDSGHKKQGAAEVIVSKVDADPMRMM